MPPLTADLQDAIKATGAPLGGEQIERIVNAVLLRFKPSHNDDEKLIAELKELSDFIKNAKAEIATIRPADISDKHIPSATLELDAIVEQTAEATNKIMDECDKISSIAGNVAAPQNDELMACVTRVYEACNFQDLTGQRIMKIVQALKHIEEKILALAATVGSEVMPPSADLTKRDIGGVPLEGPQMKGQGVSQDDIDKLLNS
jgi:chemotaxis protein CheZ